MVNCATCFQTQVGDLRACALQPLIMLHCVFPFSVYFHFHLGISLLGQLNVSSAVCSNILFAHLEINKMAR